MSLHCHPIACRVLLVGFVLIFHYSAEARPLGQAASHEEPRHHQVDFDSPTDGPRRRLLATRTVTGKVTWADNGQPVSLAYVKAFDNDVIGRETMGSVQTKADGTYTLTYTAKDWDSCCFSSTNPDIILEVWVGSDMYYKSGENANVNANIVRNIALQRYVATGTVMYYETCVGAYQARLTLYDEDIGNDDSMGGTVIQDATGKYSITASKMDDGSTWDILNGNPDVFIEISAPTMETSQPYIGAYAVVGKTAVKNDIASNVLSFGTTWVWRGDKNSSAIAIQKSIPGADKQDYVSVTEYGACSPKRMVVTIKLDINKATFSAPSDAQVTKLKALLKKGIEDNWSRTGTRALNIAGKGIYDVKVKVVESSDGYPVKLSWASTVEKECERSNNPGVLALSMSMWYNYGCEKFADPVGWEANADSSFMETAGHEFGHTVLQHAVGLTYSWTHKGSSTLLQDPSASATNWPAGTSDIDIMLYYKNGNPPPSRSFAVDVDVRRLISIAETTYSKYCGACP